MTSEYLSIFNNISNPTIELKIFYYRMEKKKLLKNYALTTRLMGFYLSELSEKKLKKTTQKNMEKHTV